MAALSAILALPASASIIHRYSFEGTDQSNGTAVRDSVGTANGQILGTGAYYDGAGQLVLPGGTSSSATADLISGYVDLPNHIINVLDNVTFETWITWQGSGAWQRIFDLGTSAAGEDVSNGGGNYLFLSPAGDVNLRFAVREPVNGTEPVQLTAAAPLSTGEEICITVTYDYANNAARMFSNGVLVVKGPANVALKDINDVNNWLGRSQWGDPMFQGSYNEFRIYDTALNPIEVAASYLSGPGTPDTSAAKLGAIQAVHLQVIAPSMTLADKQTVSSTVDFDNASGIALLGVSGVTYASDKQSVAKVSAAGEVEAVGIGTANLSVTYGGKTDVVSVSVKGRQQGLATAGTLYVDLRASDEASDTAIWPNHAGAGDFSATGAPVYVADVAGTGLAGVQFTGTDAYAGPASVEDIEGGSNRSIEVWAYNPSLADEETLVAWGHRGGGPDRSNMSFNYGANGTWGAVGAWGDDVGWNGAPAAGQWHYLVYTYDGAKNVKVYSDGLLKNTKTLGSDLVTFAGFPIRIGAQAEPSGVDFDFGQALTGYIAAVRVHGGLLSGNDVANNFIYGIEGTAPGDLQGVDLKLSSTTLVGPRAYATSTVKANYANRKYLDVMGFSTFTSSDPTVATVDTVGRVVAVGVGSATITANYQGAQGTQVVTVIAPPDLALKHRYSFGESEGSTSVKDSVGTADGVIKGAGAAFTGAGQLTLPGGTSSSAAADSISGYVDLPNGIVSSLANVTFEAWVTWQGSGSWQRIFDFGTSNGGEDVSDGNGAYFFLCPQGDANLRFALRDPATGAEPTQLTSSRPLTAGEEIYLAATYNFNNNVAVLYSNAVQVATGTATVPPSAIKDVNNWLGRSQWGDPMFQGSYNEFRIWEGTLSAEQVAANFAAGADTIPDASPKPVLSIAQTGTSVVIGWPSTASGFSLESSATIGAGAVWSAVDTSAAVVVPPQKQLTVPAQAAARFYRLKK